MCNLTKVSQKLHPHLPYLGYPLENNRKNRIQGGGLTKQCKCRLWNVTIFFISGRKSRTRMPNKIFTEKQRINNIILKSISEKSVKQADNQMWILMLLYILNVHDACSIRKNITKHSSRNLSFDWRVRPQRIVLLLEIFINFSK